MAQKKKNFLVLGAAGFLGTNLLQRLVCEPHGKIVAVDMRPFRLHGIMNERGRRVEFVRGDIRDGKLMRRLVRGADVIFQSAAETSHPQSVENPIRDAEVNCIGNLTVLLAVRDANPSAVVVFPGSSTSVGMVDGKVVDEDTPDRPIEFYSADKGVAEHYYRIFHRLFGLKTVVLRFANLYGPFGRRGVEFGFANHFINLAVSGKPITIFGNGLGRRNLMFVEDAINAMLLAATRRDLFGESFFAVHLKHHSIQEVAEAVADIFDGRVMRIPWPPMRKKIDVADVRISGARFYKKTGWRPMFSLREGLEKTRRILGKMYE